MSSKGIVFRARRVWPGLEWVPYPDGGALAAQVEPMIGSVLVMPTIAGCWAVTVKTAGAGLITATGDTPEEALGRARARARQIARGLSGLLGGAE